VPAGHTATERIETVVIGAGQAGLAVGYHLSRHGLPYVILESRDRVGGSWWDRWDAMRLFTPVSQDSLPGLKIRAPTFPDCATMTRYFMEYATHFRLSVRTGRRVDAVSVDHGGYLVTAGDELMRAANVVVATGEHNRPRIPEFADDLDPRIVSIHSREYRRPAQLAEGPVLIVGAGNSGADIALDVATGHRTYLSGRHPGHLPLRIERWHSRHVLSPMAWFVQTRVLNRDTRLGRAVLSRARARTPPLYRIRPTDLRRSGVIRVPRTVGVVDGVPRLSDGRLLPDVANVVWCTGFRPDHSWLAIGGLDPAAPLPSRRCAVTGQPGLFVIGQAFQQTFTSHTVGGVGRDAAYIAAEIAARHRTIAA
jgi:putative flavoprotein involved in K+ transport